ncbi:MAG: DUF4271 domain-containing protein [Tannerellaceae bacterium]|nr:DUF4271 domain-containing protein [Tannerellaceae bacterium]
MAELQSLPLGQWQSVHDFAIALVFLLLVLFALLYHFRHDHLFHPFLPFQASLLTAGFYVLMVTQTGEASSGNGFRLPVLTLVAFLCIHAFYLFKQGLYFCLGWTFATESERVEWRHHYRQLTGYWSVSLYITVSYYIADPSLVPVILLIVTFVAYRLALLYQTARIFSVSGTKHFLLSLYFCAQEITPLLLFWKGVAWVEKTLASSPLWQ